MEKWKLSWLRIFFSSVSLLREKKRKETRLGRGSRLLCQYILIGTSGAGEKGKGREIATMNRTREENGNGSASAFCCVDFVVCTYEYVLYSTSTSTSK